MIIFCQMVSRSRTLPRSCRTSCSTRWTRPLARIIMGDKAVFVTLANLEERTSEDGRRQYCPASPSIPPSARRQPSAHVLLPRRVGSSNRPRRSGIKGDSSSSRGRRSDGRGDGGTHQLTPRLAFSWQPNKKSFRPLALSLSLSARSFPWVLQSSCTRVGILGLSFFLLALFAARVRPENRCVTARPFPSWVVGWCSR